MLNKNGSSFSNSTMQLLLCDIFVHIGTGLRVSLHVILLNQSSQQSVFVLEKLWKDHSPFNIVLDLRYVQHSSAARRLDHLCDQFSVRDLFAALHDPHDGRLRLKMSVGCHPLVRLLVLLLRLLKLNLIDLDPELRVRKARIEREFIRRSDVSSLWLLAEHPIFGTCQRLKRALELLVGCVKAVSTDTTHNLARKSTHKVSSLPESEHSSDFRPQERR